MSQFLRTSLAFTLGLIGVLFVTERIIGARLARHNGHGLIGPEVYLAVKCANQPSTSIRVVYLGDSVAHQLFPPGGEARPDERFLTCNQATSVAGQCYLLEDVLRSCPDVRDAYLLYYPGSFANDLAPPLTNDYFCQFFHEPAQIREVFRVTRDFRLGAIQSGRFLLPNILGMNSAARPASVAGLGPPVNGQRTGDVAGDEPLLDLLNKLAGTPPRRWPPPEYDQEGRQFVELSGVSRYYLEKMRRLCAARSVRLHILPCPCSEARPFVDVGHVYDQPILYIDQTHFGDSIHLRKAYVEAARRQVIDFYQLAPLTPPQAALGG